HLALPQVLSMPGRCCQVPPVQPAGGGIVVSGPVAVNVTESQREVVNVALDRSGATVDHELEGKSWLYWCVSNTFPDFRERIDVPCQFPLAACLAIALNIQPGTAGF